MASPPRKRVLLMYGNGGGGHKASASAVRDALAASPHAPALHVHLADATAVSGAAAGDWLYNVLLSHNAVSTIELMHSAIQFLWPLAQPRLLAAFRAFWARSPDLAVVVSFVPMLNAVFADTLPPHVTLFTVLTDFSHTHAHPWIQHPRQRVVAGTEIALAQALAMGFVTADCPSASHVVAPTSGMVVHPRFYAGTPPDARARKRAHLRLHPRLPTVLILFGAAPPTDSVLQLVDRFLARPPRAAVNVIAVCARNRHLYDRLQRRRARHPHAHLCVTGFSDEIPLLMHVSDVLVGKPGPGAVSEAFVSALPCVLVTGAAGRNVMKQEKDVLDWVRRTRIGFVAHTSAEAASVTVQQMHHMRDRILSMPRNTAVFEVRRLILASMAFSVDDDHDPDCHHHHHHHNADHTLPTEHPSEQLVEHAPAQHAPQPQDLANIPHIDLAEFTAPPAPSSSSPKHPAASSQPAPTTSTSIQPSPARTQRHPSLSPTTVRPASGQSPEHESPTLPNSRATYAF